jgi:hypothetical protein
MAKKISIVTFKGCQTSMSLKEKLLTTLADKDINVEVELKIVPSEIFAEDFGLFGSPTILLDGNEYQKNLRGKPGFY